MFGRLRGVRNLESEILELKIQEDNLRIALAARAADDLLQRYEEFSELLVSGELARSYNQLVAAMNALQDLDPNALKVLASSRPYYLEKTEDLQFFVEYLVTRVADGRTLFEALERIYTTRGLAGNPLTKRGGEQEKMK